MTILVRPARCYWFWLHLNHSSTVALTLHCLKMSVSLTHTDVWHSVETSRHPYPLLSPYTYNLFALPFLMGTGTLTPDNFSLGDFHFTCKNRSIYLLPSPFPSIRSSPLSLHFCYTPFPRFYWLLTSVAVTTDDWHGKNCARSKSARYFYASRSIGRGCTFIPLWTLPV